MRNRIRNLSLDYVSISCHCLSYWIIFRSLSFVLVTCWFFSFNMIFRSLFFTSFCVLSLLQCNSNRITAHSNYCQASKSLHCPIMKWFILPLWHVNWNWSNVQAHCMSTPLGIATFRYDCIVFASHSTSHQVLLSLLHIKQSQLTMSLAHLSPNHTWCGVDTISVGKLPNSIVHIGLQYARTKSIHLVA